MDAAGAALQLFDILWSCPAFCLACYFFLQMAAQVQSLTPQQMAMYQQQMGIPLQQFQLAGQMSYLGAAGAAQGMPAASAGGFANGIDAQMLAHQMAAQVPYHIPMPMPTHTPGPGITTTNNPVNDRHFWKEEQQQELLHLVADPAFRQSKLGAFCRPPPCCAALRC